jgi:23S rRNA G2069 N7-methylase RlmK/C1962 C5-methylase RlmI
LEEYAVTKAALKTKAKERRELVAACQQEADAAQEEVDAANKALNTAEANLDAANAKVSGAEALVGEVMTELNLLHYKISIIKK